MTDLRELYPMPLAVPFGSGTVEVTGLSLRKLTALIHQYPDLIGVLSGGKVAFNELLSRVPDAALAAFALVVHDEETVKAFDDLAFGQQADILGAIYDLTVGGKRAGPFLASVAAQLRLTPPNEASPNSSPNSTSSSVPADTEATSVT